jgi:hypothetical protein
MTKLIGLLSKGMAIMMKSIVVVIILSAILNLDRKAEKLHRPSFEKKIFNF